MCPVIQNFECEMCRYITCKRCMLIVLYLISGIYIVVFSIKLLRCGKVTEVIEQIYDFALQLPKKYSMNTCTVMHSVVLAELLVHSHILTGFESVGYLFQCAAESQ